MKHVYVISIPNSSITKIGVTKNHPKGRADSISFLRDEPARVFAYATVEPKRASLLERRLKETFAAQQLPIGLEWLSADPAEVTRMLRSLLLPDELLTIAHYVQLDTPKPRRKNQRHKQETVLPDRDGVNLSRGAFAGLKLTD